MKVLFVADVFGRPGRRALASGLAHARRQAPSCFVVVNGENAAGGFGITPKIAGDMLALDIDVITTGNHVWDRREIYPLLDREARLLRPENYPSTNPGGGVWTGEAGGVPAAVINLQGRVFMKEIDCPFRKLDDVLARAEVRDARIVIVDFHAEATAEKVAFARFADGRVSAVMGTHTHVPSADASILEGGTAYVTDAGMTGPHAGVIGVRAEAAIERFIHQTPNRFEVADDDVRVQGAWIDVDPESGRAVGIERIDWPLEEIAA